MTSQSSQDALTARPGALDALRTNLDNNALGPVRTLGRTVELVLHSLVSLAADLLRGRIQLREIVVQAWFLVSVTAIPAFLMAIPFGVIVTIQIGSIVNQIGAGSLMGAASGLTVIQQAAPMAAGLLLGGAGASAIAADLGSRTIREEVDAMRVMGIDPVRRLVVPRILAAAFVAPLLCIFITVVGIGAAYYLAVAGQDVTPGSYWLSFGAYATTRDFGFALVKAAIFGIMIAVLGCQHGLEAKGGARGVADAVNTTVVVSTVGIIVLNFALTQIYTTYFPMRVG
ncbi:MlaE family ABC transporter permease [Tsukamurella ocularis]|uniref:MlaE family ABC transporter permease n=1 Tax=Tsukamurella ocularis TaxID=1970234 RepID=UPI0021670033|nr:ABC transporter permease [Tsukamurella ocularis]MCS3779221.1 phospholipid/cholesterol/gamma-HCH transport system permease protein [Tsukamurella ocularis]MCS3787159.1 phospholipid/cholesterol/gamma-HCH transport system permease protein [Tsukamurella ocularis]MCS3852550.1 phospholipid/cholesterol/gamma-HCH transport system permease protein [Tsukamurella ocularis]